MRSQLNLGFARSTIDEVDQALHDKTQPRGFRSALAAKPAVADTSVCVGRWEKVQQADYCAAAIPGAS
jgi:hypothetical protein